MEKFIMGFKSGSTILLDLVDGQKLILDIIAGMNSAPSSPVQIFVTGNVFINTSEVEFIAPAEIAHPLHVNRHGRLSE